MSGESTARRRAWRTSWLVLQGALLASLGLAQVGQWTSHLSTNGLVSLATDPVLPGVVYTNVARSLDSGKTWQPLGLNPPRSSVGAGPAGTVYAGPDFGSSVMFKSTDSGQTWTSIPFSDGLSVTETILVDPTLPSTVYAAGVHAPGGTGYLFPIFGVLEKTIDGGQTWTDLTEAPDVTAGLSAVAVDPVVGGTVYVSSPDGNLKSTDGGTTWIALPALIGSLRAWVVDRFQPGRMYVINLAGQLLESDDGGSSVSALPGVPNNTFSAIVLDPVRPNRIYGALASGPSLGSVAMSDDGGMTWQGISNGFPAATAFSLVIDAQGRFLHVSTYAGVYDYEIAPDAGALTLDPGRAFSIRLSASDQRTGRTGSGVATPVNDLWGYFSIPAITGNPNNPEVFVKMLDGTALNGSYWFFYGGLTDLEYTLTVTEVSTGRQRAYTKPAGSECGGSDTAAFGP